MSRRFKWNNSLNLQDWRFNLKVSLRGAMGVISVILVKNHCLILLNKFNLHTIIYNSLKFQISITAVKSFIRPCVNFCGIKYLIRVFCTPYFLFITFWAFWQIQNAKASTIFKLLSSDFFYMFHKVWLTKHAIRVSYILDTFQNKK